MQTTLYLMLGFPGAGKTTASKIISELTGAEHIWADQERRLKHGHPTQSPTYSQAENDELYIRLNNKAEATLKKGKSVVYDTAFNHQADRDKLRAIADRLLAKTIIIWVRTPVDIAKDRATSHDKHTDTRALGNFMSDEQFEHLINKLEHPKKDEIVIELDGLKLTKEYIKNKIK